MNCNSFSLVSGRRREKVMEKSGPLIIAMKGHPGTGKSTMAHAIAAAVGCPLLDKDDVRDCTEALQKSLAGDSNGLALLNDLSYAVLWRIAQTQVQLGLVMVIDSPLSRKAHLDRLTELGGPAKARVIIVECSPSDEAEWRRRLEQRGRANGGTSWHKPTTWQDLQRLMEGYQGCTNYDIGDVPRLVLDTTSSAGIDEQVGKVLRFVQSVVINGGPTSAVH